MAKPRDWDSVIGKLNSGATSKLKIKMGSAGSAQVTRCRLLEKWKGLEAWTESEMLFLERKGKKGSLSSKRKR
jgi:hypothetical protein